MVTKININSSAIYGVVLAGGSGTRFWPKSRQDVPKQLCQLGSSKKTMIEETLDRVDDLIPPHQRMIITHQKQYERTKKIVGSSCPKIIAEPEAKNTAAALAMAALEIAHTSPHKEQSIMVSLHADHLIQDRDHFLSFLNQAIEVAAQDWLCLIGIQPTGPETGYGYIERGDFLKDLPQAYKVKAFYEKPNKQTAEAYLETKRFAWNSGLFVWKVQTILEELKTYLPATLERLSALIAEAGSFTKVPPEQMARIYKELENIAIDHAILEKSKKVAAVNGSFHWQDVGSWSALSECFPANQGSNLVFGDAELIDCENCLVDTDGPFVGMIGLKDIVVVHHKKGILVCHKDNAQDVKKIVSKLQEKNRLDLI